MLPWIITFGPLDDADEWEPVVCGPYEHAHALALAEEVVADEELMANETQALLMHTPDSRAFNARSLGLGESALEDLRSRFREGEPPHGLRD